MPCLGKSTFYRTHFQPAEYVHVNQDTLSTRSKCIKAAEAAINEGKSCVIGEPQPTEIGARDSSCSHLAVDNTNRDKETRAHYVRLAQKLKIPVRYVSCSLQKADGDSSRVARCFLFEASKELAWHNNLYRAFNQPHSESLSQVIIVFVVLLTFF